MFVPVICIWCIYKVTATSHHRLEIFQILLQTFRIRISLQKILIQEQQQGRYCQSCYRRGPPPHSAWRCAGPASGLWGSTRWPHDLAKVRSPGKVLISEFFVICDYISIKLPAKLVDCLSTTVSRTQHPVSSIPVPKLTLLLEPWWKWWWMVSDPPQIQDNVTWCQ